MLQQQQQPNGIGRPSGPGLPTPQGVPQIRNQVNISQQQRLPPNMTAGNARMPPQQMLQAQAQIAQAAQVRAMQVAAQAQAAQSTAANMNGIGPSMNNSHLSPPYNNRATTSSPMPHSSPPHLPATIPNAASSPRPPSAQSQGNIGPAPQVPGNAMPRQGSIGHFFPMVSNMQGMQNMQNMSNANFTQEQMEHALRLQSLVQASTTFR
jgi:chromatin modification-related protein VID21